MINMIPSVDCLSVRNKKIQCLYSLLVSQFVEASSTDRYIFGMLTISGTRHIERVHIDAQ